MTHSFVVDANPILSAMLGGAARDVLLLPGCSFCASQHTLFEVAKYLPNVAVKINVPEPDLFAAFESLPIIPYQPNDYDPQMKVALRLIAQRDMKDAHVLALACT